ncbi:hypothetical protein N7478_002973 [Penicillium angulare]|uniref:uncharacterized protein n=1 Tax=Penicillium angulare TaxID=116970 RepID=UPI002540D19E|nr:uncharacterized protein N7478_002973 [Penicillium angulare]KAJ5287287.1 hypothetical protein N7478_002973 [Penicillium angulare]
MSETKISIHIPPTKEGQFSPGGPTPSINPQSLNPATKNYRLNHLALRITDPNRSLHFYIDLLGMRVVFSMNAGPFTIYYLGYPPPDTKDGEVGNWAGKTAAIPVLMKCSGLLELYHVHGSEKGVVGTDVGTRSETNAGTEEGMGVSNGNVPPNLGFAHLGFTVPDVKEAVERLKQDGVRILKDVGICSREDVPLSEWEAERGVGRGEIHGNYAWFVEQFAMIADPDGYMIELMPQEM